MDKNRVNWNAVSHITIWLTAIAMLLALCGCRGGSPMVSERTHMDSVWLRLYERDSIYIHDSVMLETRGDTVWLTKWRDRYRYRAVHDTLRIVRVDSVPYRVEVEKSLTRWQRAKMETGGWAIGALGGIAILCLLRLAGKHGLF